MNCTYSVIYRLYYHLKRRQKKILSEGKRVPGSLANKLACCEWYFNVFWKKWTIKHPSFKRGVTDKKRRQQVIVSMTSFPARIDVVWLTIETLLNQSVKPDRIILWLAECQFHGIDQLPEQLLRQMERGLEIRFCEDLRSHKKYYYVMQECPEDLIILTDDDAFFPGDMVEKLLELHKKYPRDIIGSTVAVVGSKESLPDQWGRPVPGERIRQADNIQPFSGQGTLYPPHCFDEPLIFNKELFMRLCPNADDLWLFYMADRKHTKCSVIWPERSMPVAIYGTGSNSLWQINGRQRGNDTQWTAIRQYFRDNQLET